MDKQIMAEGVAPSFSTPRLSSSIWLPNVLGAISRTRFYDRPSHTQQLHGRTCISALTVDAGITLRYWSYEASHRSAARCFRILHQFYQPFHLNAHKHTFLGSNSLSQLPCSSYSMEAVLSSAIMSIAGAFFHHQRALSPNAVCFAWDVLLTDRLY